VIDDGRALRAHHQSPIANHDTSMTYFQFLLAFIIPPAVLLSLWARPTRWQWAVVGLMAGVTYVWTTPWDNYLVGSGVWYYSPDLVSGIVLGYVPIEEYTFFGLQCWLVGVWTYALFRWLGERVKGQTDGRTDRRPTFWQTAIPVLAVAALAAVAAAWLVPGTGGAPRAADLAPLPFGGWNYLSLILVWALPVVAGQWVLGSQALTTHWKTWLLGGLVPGVYLTLIDSIAIGEGTWTIAASQSLNVFVLGHVPIEEGVFFLITSLMVTQGVLMFATPYAGERLRAWTRKTNDGQQKTVEA
jgi:putative membrane protein